MSLKFDKILFWIGEFENPLLEDHSSDYVLDSVINYYNEENPSIPYRYKALFLDNGAYTIARKKNSIRLDKIMKIQEEIKPDITVPFDYPLLQGMSTTMMRKRWQATQSNIKYWQECSTLSRHLSPALHAWSWESLNSNIRWLQRHADTNIVSIGSLVMPTFENDTSYFGDRSMTAGLFSMMYRAFEVIKANSDFKIHIFGFGSSCLTLHLCIYLGMADSFDSQGHRIRAAYGKIILPGITDRYVGNGTSSSKTKKLSKDEEKLLQNCSCSICKNDYTKLWKDWKARAIHNLYVMKMEWKKAHILKTENEGSYERYVENIFLRSGVYYLWVHAKKLKKYSPIDYFIK